MRTMLAIVMLAAAAGAGPFGFGAGGAYSYFTGGEYGGIPLSYVGAYFAVEKGPMTYEAELTYAPRGYEGYWTVTIPYIELGLTASQRFGAVRFGAGPYAALRVNDSTSPRKTDFGGLLMVEWDVGRVEVRAEYLHGLTSYSGEAIDQSRVFRCGLVLRPWEE